MEVTNTYVRLVHQNMGLVEDGKPETDWHEPVGAKLGYDYQTKTISSPEDYTVKGWLRMPRYQEKYPILSKKESLVFPRDFLLLDIKELYRIKDVLSLAIV